jgi:NAD(P)-dependent dehydrogenase (short-subunit alcohol dehydrogenase family)
MSRVLITGAGGNLGETCVDLFLTKGFEVVGTVSPGKEFQSEKKFQAIGIDLTDEAKVNEVFSKSITNTVLDAGIFTVGGFAPGKITQTKGPVLKKMIALNFEATFYAARNVFDHMQSNGKGGRIIFIGSKPALEPEAGKDLAAYALSKSLLFRLAEMMNAEGKQKNIHVAVVVPGTIDTVDNRKWKPEGDPTWVKPEEIANRILSIVQKSKPGDDYVIKMFKPGD